MRQSIELEVQTVVLLVRSAVKIGDVPIPGSCASIGAASVFGTGSTARFSLALGIEAGVDSRWVNCNAPST